MITDKKKEEGKALGEIMAVMLQNDQVNRVEILKEPGNESMYKLIVHYMGELWIWSMRLDLTHLSLEKFSIVKYVENNFDDARRSLGHMSQEEERKNE